MSAWVERALAAVLLLALAGAAPAAGKHYGLGRTATPEEIARWDIDVRPDGQGLPPGQGTANEGEAIYVARCAACHGEFGEARGRYPALMGGEGTLDSGEPVKTVGSYWPHASTVFDYVRRAMPFGHAQSLDANQTYAVTAFVLSLNDIVAPDFVLDAHSLPGVRMPNHDGFIADDRPDVPGGEPCMRECRDAPVIAGRARQLDVTPDEAGAGSSASGAAGVDPARGEQVFAQCQACHSLSAGEHRVGPSLQGLFGRAAGAASGFTGYSTAMKAAGFRWDAESLRAFIHAPQEVVPGTSMPYAGLRDAAALADLVAYLEQALGAP